VSDYFSFVGADKQGHVAFAIETSRGRDGSAYQAEHPYMVLHDEYQGWVDLVGAGRYENTNNELLPIPDSPCFQFVGQSATGLTIHSPVNQLTVSIAPIKDHISRSDRENIFSLGSASARLIWKERMIQGRLIYAYLVKKNFNLMTRRSLKGLAEFQGLYLLVGSMDDLYIQRQRGESAFTLLGSLLGFSVLSGQPKQLDTLRFEVPKYSLALGTYRWPTVWQASWQGSKGPASLDLKLLSRKQIGNWFFAGFSMGVVAGRLSYDGEELPVYGLAELLMM
jgi:hypothetical protein